MMGWVRLLRVALRLAWPHVLLPWRSPLLRWRMETYGVAGSDGRLLRADEITPRLFLLFCLRHRRAILRFLRAAARW